MCSLAVVRETSKPAKFKNTQAMQSKAKMAGKRKRAAANKLSPEEQHNVERADRHRALVKFCEKQVRKEGKAVKTFEAQKIVKRLKLLGGEGGAGNGTESGDANSVEANDKMKRAQEKRRRQAERLEKKLRLTKAYNVDRLVALCSKRIGLGNLAPPPSDDVEEQQGGDNAKEEKEVPPADEEKGSKEEMSEEDEALLSQLTEDILKHKRLVDVVEKLNDRITDHRRWVLRREDYLFGGAFPGQDDGIPAGGGKKRKGSKKGSGKAENDARADHAGPAALFIGSLSGAGMDDGDGNGGEGSGDYYGPGGHEDEYGIPIKKNRPGQRQRKAKMMAIEAKKSGKTWDSSSNWREKKKSNDDGGSYRRNHKSNAGDDGRQRTGNEQKVSASGLKTSDQVAASDVATMGKDWKEAGKAHPSWAAQQAQKAKSGIQQFAGTKITFD